MSEKKRDLPNDEMTTETRRLWKEIEHLTGSQARYALLTILAGTKLAEAVVLAKAYA